MDRAKLQEILNKHKKWIDGEDGGERADLRCSDLRCSDLRCSDLSGSDLRYSDLSNADLSNADLRDADLSSANLSSANLRGADLRDANLRDANLRDANLRGADLRGADLDFSCLPLWCGSLSAHFDDRQLKQIAYHLVKAGLQSKNASEKTKQELAKLVDFANGFHRAEECGRIVPEEEGTET